jgi:hypothetical protein
MMHCHGEELPPRTHGLLCNFKPSLVLQGDVANSDWLPEHRAFDKVAYDVRSGDVNLLDQRRFFRRRKQTDVTKISHQAAFGSGKSHRRNAESACSAQRGEDVG